VKRKVLVAFPFLAALLLGFVLGHLRTPAAAHSREPLYFVDPMHPAYKSDKPGIAPDCGMQLVPVYAEDVYKTSLARTSSNTASVSVDPATQQRYGIRVTTVEEYSGSRTVRVLGRVTADETRIFRVNIGTDGYIKSTQDDAVGNRVKKDQRLAIIYSPEFLTLIGGYMSASERTPAVTNHDPTPTPSQFAAGVQARGDRLRNLGMSDLQIEELSKSRTIPEDVYIVSPVDGFVISRNISSGQRFERFTEFYRIADLSHVWILADVFGGDAQAFKPGTLAKITLPDTGRTLHARVTNVLPEVDPTTRTMRVRLEAENPGFTLRPDMFVNVELPVSAAAGLTVPVDALLDSGASKRVFVESADGSFEAREVVTGWRADDRVQIVRGLQAGEKVVSAGTFLIDSESRLQSAGHASGLASASPGLEPVDRKIN
jgi:Cu(I)/Ag(I) efflux system membrane fusion protein